MERTPVFKLSLVILSYPYPLNLWFSCSFFCNSDPEYDCNQSFQAIDLIYLMTFGIAHPVAVFHMNHFEGWNLLGGSVASLIMSGNKLWSSEKDVITISSSPHLLVFPGQVVWSLGKIKHISSLLAITPFSKSPPEALCLRSLHWNTEGFWMLSC